MYKIFTRFYVQLIKKDKFRLLKVSLVGVEQRVALGDGSLTVTGLADVVTLELDITSLAKQETGRVHADEGEDLNVIVIDSLNRAIWCLLHLDLA